MNKKIALGGGIAAVLVIIIAVAVIVLQPKKINVEDYVEITCSGYNGYAVARADLDEGSLYQAILAAKGKQIDYDDIDSLEALGSALSEEWAISACVDKIVLSLSQEENLSNGDTVTAEITYDNEAAKEQKVQFTGSTVTLKVEGLEEITELDPFDGLEVSFSGISPNGALDYAYNGDNSAISVYSFSASSSRNLKNGDVVTITYSFNEDSMLRQGYVITNQEKEYEVGGLDEYVQNYADLTEDLLNTMRSEAEDKIYAYTANYNETNSMNDLSYAGYILNTAKDGGILWGSQNSLYLIYSGDVSNTSGDFPTTKVYYPVKFSNLLNVGGELSYGSLDGIEGSSNFDGGWYTTKGYINPLICYVDIVEKNRDTYNSECGDGFEEFAEFEHVTQLSDISDGYKQELYNDALGRVENYIANTYNGGSTAAGLALVGDYLLTAKNPGLNFAGNNTYIVVYSALVSNSNGAFPDTTVYFPVSYSGIVSLPSGEYMVTESGKILGDSLLPDSYYSTKGYVDGPQMFEKLITANRDNYTYEVSDGLKQFGQ